ncbi:phage head-tail joining protein [Seohaeicola nanhaiensis]|uniref:Phage head-tail joining protein n=1 Tax=Seohaeicola nanhaiensis TaxID=1387282 RepID=A0ABV9KHV9_9RHOB
MAWTQTELDALKSAYAAGTTVVQFDGKRIEYDSESGLLKRIRTIEAEISSQSGKAKARVGYVTFSRT